VKTIRSLSQSVALRLFLALKFAIAVLGQKAVLHGRVVAVTELCFIALMAFSSSAMSDSGMPGSGKHYRNDVSQSSNWLKRRT
jgi:hypothetical protein